MPNNNDKPPQVLFSTLPPDQRNRIELALLRAATKEANQLDVDEPLLKMPFPTAVHRTQK